MIVPLRDDIASRTFPIMTYLMMVACGVAFYHTLSLSSLEAVQRMIGAYGVIPAQVTGHAAPAPAALRVRLVTSVFLHGGWLYLIGNMLFLWIFADNLEDPMGRGPFAIFYQISSVAGNLVHIAANPLSTEPTIGARALAPRLHTGDAAARRARRAEGRSFHGAGRMSAPHPNGRDRTAAGGVVYAFAPQEIRQAPRMPIRYRSGGTKQRDRRTMGCVIFG